MDNGDKNHDKPSHQLQAEIRFNRAEVACLEKLLAMPEVANSGQYSHTSIREKLAFIKKHLKRIERFKGDHYESAKNGG